MIDAFLTSSPIVPAEAADPSKLALILFTSGTTAKSKGVMLSQNNIFAMTDVHVDILLSAEEALNMRGCKIRSFASLPMFHVAALNEIMRWFCYGGSVNICTDPRRFYRDLSKMPSDHCVLVPVMLKSVYDDVMRGRNRFEDLKFISVGAATVNPKMIQDLHKKGYYVTQGYGMTEAIGTGIYNAMSSIRYADSIGKPISGVACKLVDGELCLHSKGIMLGYYKDPKATAAVIDTEGWLHTGDLARIDEEGYIYLTGRKKNLIILSSGENINPEELENLLYKNSDITETVVVEKDGKICAQVYCPESASESIRNYIGNLNRTLPMYKHISTVEFRATPFERTSTGKIKRY